MSLQRKFQTLISSPQLALRKLNQAYYWRGQRYNEAGIDIMTEDWDNLIILDACRYDTFEELNYIDGNLQNTISRGSATPEFLLGNFHGRTFNDTIYITGNPMLDNQEQINANFFKIERVWADEGWDEEAGTVLPETMTNRVIQVHERYPNKRLLVHFVQPHHPFISNIDVFDFDIQRRDTDQEINPWMELILGNLRVDHSELIQAYKDTLTRVLPAVKRLVHYVNGKSVITSDHGNVFGERVHPIPYREWGHPPGIHVPKLVRVPWLKCQSNGSRREVISEDSGEQSELTDEEPVGDRLSALGYV